MGYYKAVSWETESGPQITQITQIFKLKAEGSKGGSADYADLHRFLKMKAQGSKAGML